MYVWCMCRAHRVCVCTHICGTKTDSCISGGGISVALENRFPKIQDWNVSLAAATNAAHRAPPHLSHFTCVHCDCSSEKCLTLLHKNGVCLPGCHTFPVPATRQKTQKSRLTGQDFLWRFTYWVGGSLHSCMSPAFRTRACVCTQAASHANRDEPFLFVSSIADSCNSSPSKPLSHRSLCTLGAGKASECAAHHYGIQQYQLTSILHPVGASSAPACFGGVHSRAATASGRVLVGNAHGQGSMYSYSLHIFCHSWVCPGDAHEIWIWVCSGCS